MARVSFASVEDAPSVSAPEGAVGAVETRALFDRDRDPIHLHTHHLAPGATERFAGTQMDRLLYVWKGSIDAAGARLGARSSAIVEYGASLAVTAGPEGATLLEFNMKERSSEDRSGGHVHLMPKERVPHRDPEAGTGHAGMFLHADSQCPTCKLWFHENDYVAADIETALHSHSEDEVIFVRAGSMRVGRKIYGPGTALFVAANTKYEFWSGPDGLSFVNFRGMSPTYTSADGKMVLDEAELWHKAVGKPEYLAT